MKENSKSGTIYVIQNRQTSKSFVGGTVLTLPRIWSAHQSWACCGRRSPLHCALRSINPQNFLIKELEKVPIHQLREKQQEWIIRLNSTVPWGYNPAIGVSGCRVRFADKDVNRILKLSATHGQTAIAKKFGVSQATISRIIARKIYK